ncbi:unnamed protein product [Adineta ricciae]|uniref:Uncharacterized protein n=1 Tax=Adineta ricciae TaxID=249248 RepID=A0A815THX7_ADIRI|nr:unnamed protein product [Adineta ricciae]
MISNDIRLGDIITEDDNGDRILIGFPYDEGIRRNNGRIGFKLDPNVFRQSLKRTGTVVNAEYEDLDIRKYPDGNTTLSGSPFRQLIEDQRFHQNLSNRFIEFASRKDLNVLLNM